MAFGTGGLKKPFGKFTRLILLMVLKSAEKINWVWPKVANQMFGKPSCVLKKKYNYPSRDLS